MFQDTLSNWLRRSREVKSVLRRNLIEAPRQPRPPIQIPPTLSPLVDPRSVGRAYDCWFRIATIGENRLGKARFREFLGYKIYYDAKYHLRQGFSGVMEECLSTLDRCYSSRKYVNSAVLRSAFILGYFEREFRTGEPVTRWDLDVRRDSITELANLATSSDTSWAIGHVTLNPNFTIAGPKGALAGDGDLIVDGALYDLKTSRELRPLETLRQLVGYVVMNSLRRRKYPISAVGYYYVRYGLYVRKSLSEVCAPEQFDAIRRFFGRKLGRAPHGRISSAR